MYDAALLKLKKSVPIIDHANVICSPKGPQQFRHGTKCVIAGWGKITYHGEVLTYTFQSLHNHSSKLDHPHRPHQAIVKIIGQKKCQRLYSWRNITNDMICTWPNRERSITLHCESSIFLFSIHLQFTYSSGWLWWPPHVWGSSWFWSLVPRWCRIFCKPGNTPLGAS